MSISNMNPAEILGKIRYDPLTKKGSVLDAIQLVTGCTQRNASRELARIKDKFPDVTSQVTMHKFSGRKQKPTPAASLPVLFNIMVACPGSRAREFAQRTSDVFTRAFGADEELAREIKRRKVQLEGTPLEDAAKGIRTTVDDALACMHAPIDPPADEGMLYVVTSPLLPFFKLGYWTGTEEKLRSRFATYYGPQLELHTWPCTQCRACEAVLLQEFAAHSMGGELFSKECMADVLTFLEVAAEM